jgi:DNA-binding cell septation regulator SpoVG
MQWQPVPRLNPSPVDGTVFSISELRIERVRPQGGLVAFASCVLNQLLYVGNIGVHLRLDGDGYRLVYPAKALRDGRSIPIVRPICQRADELFLVAICNGLSKQCWHDQERGR